MKFKLIKAYIRQNIKIIMMVIFIMTISTAGAFSVMLAQYSENLNYLVFQKENSTIYGALAGDLTEDELGRIKSSNRVEAVYETLDLNNFIDGNDGKLVTLEGYNKNSLEESKIKLISGRYPEKEDEVLAFNISKNYKVGEKIPGKIFYYTEKDGNKKVVMKNEEVKVVGIVDNKLTRHYLKDGMFININPSKIPESQRRYKAIIKYKTGIENAQEETAKLAEETKLGAGKIYYNKDLAYVSQSGVNKKLENPRAKNIMIYGIIFSISTLIIYSRKRIEDMKILRVVGASKRQILLILSGESCFVGAISVLLGNIFGFLLSKALVLKSNYTIAEDAMYQEFGKSLHYDPYFTMQTVIIVLVPVLIALAYEVMSVNKGFAKENRNGIIGRTLRKLTGFSLRKNKKSIDKISSSNFRKNILYLIVPVIILSATMADYSNLKRDYTEDAWRNNTMALTPYVDRDYMITREDKFIPSFGFTENDYEKIKHMEGVKKPLAIMSSDGFYISDGKELTSNYAKDGLDKSNENVLEKDSTNSEEKNKEYPFSILVMDKSEMNKNKLIYNELSKKNMNSEYPKVYLNDKFYNRDDSIYKDIFKKPMAGEIIKLKLVVKNGKDIEYKTVPVQVAGMVDNVKKIKNVFTPMLIGGVYIEPAEYKKITNYLRYTNINFSSDKDSNEVKKQLRDMFGKSGKIKYVEDTKKESSQINLVFTEMYTVLIYAVSVSVFSIISSLKIIIRSRKNEDRILRSVGAERKTIRKIYIKEGLKFGVISGLIMIAIAVYKAVKEYLFLAEVFPNQTLVINPLTIGIMSTVPFFIFFISYLIGTESISKINDEEYESL